MTERKKEKRKWKETRTSGGELKVRSSQTQKSPLIAGNQLGQKRTYSRAKENTADGPWKAEQSKN